MSLKPKPRKKKKDTIKKRVMTFDKNDPDAHLKREVNQKYPLLTRKEVDLVVRMRKLVVAIDNYEVSQGGSASTYRYQDELINYARECNGQFGI